MERKVGINSQLELEKYKKVIMSIKKEQDLYKKKEKQKRQRELELFFGNGAKLNSKVDNSKVSEHRVVSLDEKIKQLEEQKMITFQEECLMDSSFDFFDVECFLYHGLRYFDDSKRLDEGLKKLEGILEKKHILAGKYLEGYYPSSDNCNELEYVSLASYSDSIEFKVFVLQNICLLTRPSSPAYKTIYVPYDTWEYMKKNRIELQNRYSYAHGEYHVKDSVSIDDVKAIGMPHFDIRLSEGLATANYYKQQIIHLLDQYDFDIPIVDTSCYNQIIYQKSPKK